MGDEFLGGPWKGGYIDGKRIHEREVLTIMDLGLSLCIRVLSVHDPKEKMLSLMIGMGFEKTGMSRAGRG